MVWDISDIWKRRMGIEIYVLRKRQAPYPRPGILAAYGITIRYSGGRRERVAWHLEDVVLHGWPTVLSSCIWRSRFATRPNESRHFDGGKLRDACAGGACAKPYGALSHARSLRRQNWYALIPKCRPHSEINCAGYVGSMRYEV